MFSLEVSSASVITVQHFIELWIWFFDTLYLYENISPCGGANRRKHRDCIQSKKSGGNTSSKNGSEARTRTRTKNFSSPLFSSPPTILFTQGCVRSCVGQSSCFCFMRLRSSRGKTRRKHFIQIFSTPAVFELFYENKPCNSNFTCPCLAGPVSPIYIGAKSANFSEGLLSPSSSF